MADQIDNHADEAIMTVKTNGPWPVIIVPRHRPRGKEVAGTKDGLWGDDCFNSVSRVVAQLPMNGTVREIQRNIAPFCATIIHRCAIAIEGHRDGERGDVDGIGKNFEIACETDICAGINERPIIDLVLSA